MRKFTASILISALMLSGCASLVERDIFTQSKPSPNDAYDDPNHTDELTECLRKKKKDEQDPDCFLKNR